ncbi:hypothetical protein PG984_014622 [Apiospora sp. TS-2023a]
MASWKYIVAVLLTPATQAGQFLDPWAAGTTRDYSTNKQVVVGHPMTVEWSLDSGGPPYSLKVVKELWAGGTLGDVSGNINGNIQDTRYTWIVSAAEFNLSVINIFFLSVTNGKDSVTSHYFNITNNELEGSSTSTLAPSTPAAPTTTVWQTAAPVSSDEPLSRGMVIGLAVGIVAAVFCMIAGFGWWASRVLRRKKRVGVDGTTAADNTGVVVDHKNTHVAQIGGTPINEVEAQPDAPHPVYQVGGS